VTGVGEIPDACCGIDQRQWPAEAVPCADGEGRGTIGMADEVERAGRATSGGAVSLLKVLSPCHALFSIYSVISVVKNG